MKDGDFNNLYDSTLEASVLMEMLDESVADSEAGRVMRSDEFKARLAERKSQSQGDPTTVEERLEAMQNIVNVFNNSEEK